LLNVQITYPHQLLGARQLAKANLGGVRSRIPVKGVETRLFNDTFQPLLTERSCARKARFD
jgi:hypothetical protein